MTTRVSMREASVPQVLAMVMCPAGGTDPIQGLLAEIEELCGQHCASLLRDDSEHPRHALAYAVYKRALAARELYSRQFEGAITNEARHAQAGADAHEDDFSAAAEE